jgi:hydroxymethylglutaryl-CoA lyase
VLKRIKEMADEAGLELVAYVSMAFGNPYGDPWSGERVVEAATTIPGLGIRAISLADTVGAAEPELIQRVTAAVLRERMKCEVGIHMHSTRAGAAAKVLAAFDAGCRRFDSAIGGLGGCPFAQDNLVGNIPTEEVVRALEQRGMMLPIRDSLGRVMATNAVISEEFSKPVTSDM